MFFSLAMLIPYFHDEVPFPWISFSFRRWIIFKALICPHLFSPDFHIFFHLLNIFFIIILPLGFTESLFSDLIFSNINKYFIFLLIFLLLSWSPSFWLYIFLNVTPVTKLSPHFLALYSQFILSKKKNLNHLFWGVGWTTYLIHYPLMWSLDYNLLRKLDSKSLMSKGLSFNLEK